MIEALSTATGLDRRAAGHRRGTEALLQTGGSPAEKQTDQPKRLCIKSPDPSVEFIQVLF